MGDSPEAEPSDTRGNSTLCFLFVKTKTYIVGVQNHLNESVRTHKICLE